MGSICSGFMFRTRPDGTLGGFYGSSDATIQIDLGTGTRRRLHEQNPQAAIAAPGYLAEDGSVPGRDLFGGPADAQGSALLVDTVAPDKK